MALPHAVVDTPASDPGSDSTRDPTSRTTANSKAVICCTKTTDTGRDPSDVQHDPQRYRSRAHNNTDILASTRANPARLNAYARPGLRTRAIEPIRSSRSELVSRSTLEHIGEPLGIEFDCVHQIPGYGAWLKVPLGKLDNEGAVLGFPSLELHDR